MEILIALPVLLGGVAIAIAIDMGSSVSSLFQGTTDFEQVGELYDKQAALSQIITLAVLADGVVTDAEAANLRHLFQQSPKFTGDPDAAIERLREAAQRASKPDSLENTIRVVASDLDRVWKDDAFGFVAVLALRGSGFGKSDQGFRVAPSSDPGTLLEVFARGLDVEPGVRDAAIERARAMGV